MKTKASVRIVVVLVAIGLLAGYVVYSQKQQNRRVAPGSKAMALVENLKKIDGAKGSWDAEKSSNTTKLRISAQSSNHSQPALVQKKPDLIASGSKSAAIFTGPRDILPVTGTFFFSNSVPKQK